MATIGTQDFEECRRKIMAILPGLKATGRATSEQCQELESLFDYLVLLVLSQEIEAIAAMEVIAKLLQEFKEVLSIAQEQNELLRQSISNVQSKIRKLEKEFESLKTNLIVGQIVSSFERVVAQKILEESAEKAKNRTVTLHQIVDILKNRKSFLLPEILQTQNEKDKVLHNWDNLNKYYGLTGDTTPAYMHLNNIGTQLHIRP